MKLTLFSVGAFCAAAPLLGQGPLRPRPRPPAAGASSQPLPPAPRIRREPVEQERDTFRYVPPSDPVLAKAIAANIDFQQQLPNFVCQERMTRWTSRNLGKKWKRDDVVEAEILTIGNKVEYRGIKIDGKPTGADAFTQIGGPWSIGEYGATVISLFHPSSRAQFEKQGPQKIGVRDVFVYNYKIEEEHSSMIIDADGRRANPPHHGKVWIDSETGRALRVEREATYLPSDFPRSSNTSVLEYAEVEIDGQSYLLPARAQNASCQRGSPFCTRLDIEFLDYRKFTSESTLFTTDSDIEFGQEVPDRPEPRPSKEK